MLLAFVAVCTDIMWRRIPNGLTLPFAVAGFAFNLLTGGPLEGLWHTCAGLVLGLVLPGVLFMLGGMGGGDVKLLAAIGAWAGPSRFLNIFVCAALAGGVVSLFMLVRSGGLRTLKHIGTDAMLFCLSRAKVEARTDIRTIPYSVPVALGTVVGLYWRCLP